MVEERERRRRTPHSPKAMALFNATYQLVLNEDTDIEPARLPRIPVLLFVAGLNCESVMDQRLVVEVKLAELLPASVVIEANM